MTTATDPPQSPWLEAQQLRCERGDRLLFEGLDFQLSPGQVLQVEGANGSGKTSLLRMLCGLSLPTEGDIRWRGQSLQEDRAAYLEQVAYVGHNHGIKGELTALENLRFARSLGSAANGVDLEDALQRLGLAGFETSQCQRLSAGQRRRVALASLLITNAQLWLLDEPFTQVDRDGIQAVNDLLVQHVDQGGMIAMTTHHAVSFAHHPVTHLRLGG